MARQLDGRRPMRPLAAPNVASPVGFAPPSIAPLVRNNLAAQSAVAPQAFMAQPQANFGAKIAAQANALVPSKPAPPAPDIFGAQESAFGQQVAAQAGAGMQLQARQQFGQFSDAQQFARGRFVR